MLEMSKILMQKAPVKTGASIFKGICLPTDLIQFNHAILVIQIKYFYFHLHIFFLEIFKSYYPDKRGHLCSG